MTERERWIVYPLLFLALGAALRDKLSEHTKTRSIECQELTVYGEDGAGQPPVPLVQIGAIKRTSADQPHLGQIIVKGFVQADGIRTEEMQASSVNADNYFFHRIPLAPLMRSVPGVSAADQLRLQQMQQDQQNSAAQDKPADEKPPEAAGASNVKEDASTVIPPAE